MRKFFFFLLLINTFVFQAFSQVGIMGKRTLLKTDIVNGIRRPISNIELETAVTRNYSVSLSYSYLQTSLKGIYKGSYFTDWLLYTSDANWEKYLPNYNRSGISYGSNVDKLFNSIDSENSYNSKINIFVKQRLVGLSMNFFKGGAISAPYGKYFQLGFKTGIQYISGFFDVPYITTEEQIDSWKPYLNYTGEKRRLEFNDVGVRLISYFIGGGQNFLLNRRLMLDINYGTVINITHPLNSDDFMFSSIVAHKNGVNLFAFSDRMSGNGESPFGPTLNIGLYFNVKLGVLLF